MLAAIAGRSGTLLSAIAALTSTAIVSGSVAAADPNQDDQFLAVLSNEQIPAVANVPSIIASAHRVCRMLDDGMPVDGVLADLTNGYEKHPSERRYPSERITRTYQRFITAAVEVYCPYDQDKIVSIMAYSTRWSDTPQRSTAGYLHDAVDSARDARDLFLTLGIISPPAMQPRPAGTDARWLPHLPDNHAAAAGHYGNERPHGGAHETVAAALIGPVPIGEVTPTNPPKIPPPAALPPEHVQRSPRQVKPPPRQVKPPRQVEPPPQQLPPPPQQVEPPPEQVIPPPEQAVQPPEQITPPPQQMGPPAAAPQPGEAAGGGGNGSAGGNGSGNGGGGNGGNGGGDTNGGGAPARPSPVQPMPPGFVKLAP